MKEKASVCGEFAGSVWVILGQPARDRLVIHSENPADSSYLPFKIGLKGLLPEGGILAPAQRLKDPSACLETVVETSLVHTIQLRQSRQDPSSSRNHKVPELQLSVLAQTLLSICPIKNHLIALS